MPFTSSRPSGRGRLVRSTGSGVSDRKAFSEARACRARAICGQRPMICSIGASARPSKIDAATIAPAVTSPRSTSQAPSASTSDCNDSRNALVKVENAPVQSTAPMLLLRASVLRSTKRATTGFSIPWLRISSEARLALSAKRWAASTVCCASATRFEVSI